MIGFSLPETQATVPVAFHDADSAGKWLAARPQANVPVMLSDFEIQIAALNRRRVSPRDRFKAMEALRKAVFSVSNECRRRFENKPLPLAPAEQVLLDTVRRVWRNCAVAYQHCLNSCLEGDPALASRAAKVAHRVLTCLRMEQLNSYAAGVEPGAELWRNLHVLFLVAEQLGIAHNPVEDQLLGETSESTVAGQYAMALMLHLTRPFSLSAGQFSTVVRWLARWREQAAIVQQPETDAKASCVALDLAQDTAVHDALCAATLPRWLSLGKVLRKISSRLNSLAAGDSPESLKLGGGLSAETCRILLEALGSHLPHPPFALSGISESMPKLAVGTGLEVIYRLLGGCGLEISMQPVSSVDTHLSKDQLAIFGHIVREEHAPPAQKLETWRLAYRDGDELVLLRASNAGTSRLALRSLLAIRQQERYMLAVITGLQQRGDGLLFATINLLHGEVFPRGAEVRDRTTGKSALHPAFQLPAGDDGRESLLLLPAGVMARASSVRFQDASGQFLPGLRLADCLERGSEVDFWRVLAEK